MKKFIIMLLAVVAGLGMASAQRAGEFSLENNESNFNHSGVFVDLGVGAAVGDLDTDLGFSVGLGYRWHITSGINWEVLKVAYYNPQTTKQFGDASSLRIVSGFSYNTVPLLAGHPLYVGFGMGYQFNVKDTDAWKGFAYEVGAGVLLSRKCSLGIFWEGNCGTSEYYYRGHTYSEDYHFGIIGLKLGINF